MSTAQGIGIGLGFGGNRWTPKRLSSLAAWFRSDTGLTVSQWDDKSGNARPLLQAAAPDQPTIAGTTPNGKPCLRSDGANSWMQTAAFALVQPFTVLISAKWTGKAAWSYLLDGRANDTGCLARSPSSNVVSVYAGAGYAGPTLTDATWTVIGSIVDGAASSSWINADAPVAGATGAANANGITLFSSGVGESYLSEADVSEIVVVGRALTASEIAKTATYMRGWSGIP